MMTPVLKGSTQNQFMGRRKTNHIQVACVPDARGAKVEHAIMAKSSPGIRSRRSTIPARGHYESLDHDRFAEKFHLKKLAGKGN